MLFSSHSWESIDVKGQLYELIFPTLYRGLQHPWISVSVCIWWGGRVLELTPRYQEKLSFWGVKNYVDSDHTGLIHLTLVLFKGQLYSPPWMSNAFSDHATDQSLLCNSLPKTSHFPIWPSHHSFNDHVPLSHEDRSTSLILPFNPSTEHRFQNRAYDQ